MREFFTTSLRTLEYFYYHKLLNEYISTLSYEELRSARATIELDDIEGIKLNILNIIKNEMEYRIDNKSKCKIKR